MSNEQQIDERYEIAEILAQNFRLNDEQYDASDFEWAAHCLLEAGYRKQSRVIDEFVRRLLDAFPECNRDARCPAIYYDDYREIIEELAERMKGGRYE